MYWIGALILIVVIIYMVISTLFFISELKM